MPTTTASPTTITIPLPGLQGDHMVGWLAAVGVLRTLHRHTPALEPRLFWDDQKSAVLHLTVAGTFTPDDLVALLMQHLANCQQDDRFLLPHPDPANPARQRTAKTANLEAPVFRALCHTVAAAATPTDREYADWLAAWGTDGGKEPKTKANKEKMVPSKLVTATGQGHMHQFEIIRQLIEDTTAEHIRHTLFSRWAYSDPTKGHILRWDPFDCQPSVFRHRESSTDPVREERGSQWGATRLAVEATVMFTSMPEYGNGGLRTLGFRVSDDGESKPELVWPLWGLSVGYDTVATLIGLPLLHKAEQPYEQQKLRAMGITAVYAARLVNLGQGGYSRGFAPARPLWIAPQ